MSTALDLQSLTDLQKKLMELVQNGAVPPRARAEQLTYLVDEHGLDAVPAIESLVKSADEGRELKARAEQEQNRPLVAEHFIEKFEHDGRVLAAVTSGGGITYLPCGQDEVLGLKRGDPVLIDVAKVRIAGRDGALPRTGEVATVETVHSDGSHRAVLKHQERPVVAMLAHWVDAPGTGLAAGSRVVFDPGNKFVLDVLDAESDGTELLVPVSTLDQISRKDVGAVPPVAQEILFRVKSVVTHADWSEKMNVRPTCSYFFAGATGTGKSFSLKLIARELTDYVEELTGRRISRLVTADASDFYSPYMGLGEERTKAWFKRARKLAQTELRDRQGRPVRVPLILVIEEAEALMRSRGMDLGGSGHLFDRILSLILAECSSVSTELKAPIVLVVSSNKPSLMDAAALRRFGLRRVVFSTLTACQARSILEKKITAELPLRRAGDFPSSHDARLSAINRIVSFLYGDDPEQGIAEVRLVDGGRRVVNRRNLVTPAMLEEGVSAATDECLRQSADAGELLGLDAEAVIRSLQKQFEALARTLRAHNIEDYYPDWFTEETIRVEGVRPLVTHARRPRSALIRA